MSSAELARQRLRESQEVKRALEAEVPRIVEVAEALLAALRAGGKALLFGNGGSAADAQHLAAELVGRFAIDRAPLAAIALTVDTSALTAISNDYGFDEVFARQVLALGSPRDVAVALSTSGRSPNVIRGAQAARDKGLVTVALTGQDGGTLKEHVDYCVCVPSTVTSRIQECHILIGHILCEILEGEVAGRRPSPA
jgi:D-sedoheptulose 7-phosphate isomerase